MAGGAACVAKTAAQESSKCDYRCCYSRLASIEWEHVQGTYQIPKLNHTGMACNDTFRYA
eukprot:5226300-Prymnesium_polylepis.1